MEDDGKEDHASQVSDWMDNNNEERYDENTVESNQERLGRLNNLNIDIQEEDLTYGDLSVFMDQLTASPNGSTEENIQAVEPGLDKLLEDNVLVDNMGRHPRDAHREAHRSLSEAIRRSKSRGRLSTSPILNRDSREEERKKREREKQEQKKKQEEELSRKAEQFMALYRSKNDSFEEEDIMMELSKGEECIPSFSLKEERVTDTDLYIPQSTSTTSTTTTTTTTTTSTSFSIRGVPPSESQKAPIFIDDCWEEVDSVEYNKVADLRSTTVRRRDAQKESLDETPPLASKKTKTAPTDAIDKQIESDLSLEESVSGAALQKQSTPVPVLSSAERTRIYILWKELEHNLALILTKLGSIEMRWDYLWGNMYRQVFQLKTLTRGNEQLREELYFKFQEFLNDHVVQQREHLGLIVTGSSETQSELLLRSYLKRWADFAISAKYIHDIFSMHYFWVPAENGVPDVFILALMIWNQQVFSTLKSSIMAAVLNLVNAARTTNRNTDKTLIPSIIQNYIVLCLNKETPLELFLDNFATEYVEDTIKFYVEETAKNVAVGVPYFMDKAEARIEEELLRVSSMATTISSCASASICLSGDSEITTVYHALLASCWTVCDSMLNLESSFTKAVDELYKQLTSSLNSVLIEHYKDAMSSVLPCLLTSGHWDDVSRMHRLLQRINSTQIMETVTASHLREVGAGIVAKLEDSDRKKSSDFVNGLYDSLIHYRQCMKKAYGNSSSFKIILETCMTEIINKSPIAPRHITVFIDEQLRGGFKDCTDLQADIICDKVIELLKYLHDKDVFQKYYSMDLALRLLERNSNSVETERTMIAKLKANQGVSFTCNMERMFKDIAISVDVSSEFNLWYKPVVSNEVPRSKVELSPVIVSNGCWPSSIILRGNAEQNSMDFSNFPLECILPSDVDGLWSTFKAYYIGKYHGRKLTFVSHLGSADIRFALESNKQIFLHASTHMMCILSLFNTSEELSYSDIKSVTNIPDRQLKAALYSLACAKYSKTCSDKILLKNPNNKEIKEADLFKLNAHFKTKLKKLKLRTVNPLARENTARIATETEESIHKERELLCDACIVRVMKSRKYLSHNELIRSVIEQLSHRFQPQPALIKKRIQILLDREFLERTDDINMYKYVA